MAAHSPAPAASARPGAKGPTAQRCRHAVATASHRQTPRGSRAGKCANAQPKTAASSAVHPTVTVCPGLKSPPASTICSTCAAVSVRQPASAPAPGRPSMSRRTAAAATAATASLTPSSIGWNASRAADDQRQPKRRSPAVDLPGPQRRAAQHCRALPQQRRTSRPGQQPFHCVVHTFPVQYSHRASPP